MVFVSIVVNPTSFDRPSLKAYAILNNRIMRLLDSTGLYETLESRLLVKGTQSNKGVLRSSNLAWILWQQDSDRICEKRISGAPQILPSMVPCFLERRLRHGGS